MTLVIVYNDNSSSAQMAHLDEEMIDLTIEETLTDTEEEEQDVIDLLHRLDNREFIQTIHELDEWRRAELTPFDGSDESWLTHQARLIWPNDFEYKRSEYRKALGLAIRNARFASLCFNWFYMADLSKREWKLCDNTQTGTQWFASFDDKLVALLSGIFQLKYSKLPEWITYIRELMRDARTALEWNFDLWRCGVHEAVGIDDDDRLSDNYMLLNLIRLGNTSSSYETTELFVRGDLFQPMLHCGTLNDNHAGLVARYQRITQCHDIELRMLNPRVLQNGECVPIIQPFNSWHEKEINLFLQNRDRVHDTYGDGIVFDTQAEICKCALSNYKNTIQYEFRMIGQVIDLYFPKLHSTTMTCYRLSLAPYTRRFYSNCNINKTQNLCVYPAMLRRDDIVKQEWSPNGMTFEFLDGLDVKVGGDALIHDLREVRRCMAIWQNIIFDKNFLFEPDDWCFDFLLPGTVSDLIFHADRDNADGKYFPCKELSEGSDNWWVSISDFFDGVRKVVCDQCNGYSFAPNTRIMCKIVNMETGTLGDWIEHVCQVLTDRDAVEVAREYGECCNQPFSDCPHWCCNKLDLDVVRCTLNPMERVCAECLQKNWVYCSDGGYALEASTAYGLWHKGAPQVAVKNACKH